MSGAGPVDGAKIDRAGLAVGDVVAAERDRDFGELRRDRIDGRVNGEAEGVLIGIAVGERDGAGLAAGDGRVDLDGERFAVAGVERADQRVGEDEARRGR